MSEDGFTLQDSTIAIIGLGLMGGSLALALKKHCRAIYGIDSDQATLDLALSRNIVDRAEADPAKLLPQADLIILATPVPAILALLAAAARPHAKPLHRIRPGLHEEPDRGGDVAVCRNASIRSAVIRFVARKNFRLKMQTARYFNLPLCTDGSAAHHFTGTAGRGSDHPCHRRTGYPDGCIRTRPCACIYKPPSFSCFLGAGISVNSHSCEGNCQVGRAGFSFDQPTGRDAVLHDVGRAGIQP